MGARSGAAHEGRAPLLPLQLLRPPLHPPPLLLLLLFPLLFGGVWSRAQAESESGSLGAVSLEILAPHHRARTAASSTAHPTPGVPVCPDSGPSPCHEHERGQPSFGQPGAGIRLSWGASPGAPRLAETHGTAPGSLRRSSRTLVEEWHGVPSRGRTLAEAEEQGQGQDQQQQQQQPQPSPGPQSSEYGQAEAPRPAQEVVASEGTEASLIPEVALLENVYVNHRGEVLNATHRFLFGAREGVRTEPLESELHVGDKKVVELDELVNLALGVPPSRHQLMELVHRLPLLLQLCPLMPRLQTARFLLGDHRAMRGALGHLLGFFPWEHTVQPLKSDKAIILAKLLYQPIQAPCPRCAGLWPALRNTYLLPKKGLPIFSADWTCRASWQDVLQAAQTPASPPPLPSDWVVLVAGPPASLPVDPTIGSKNGIDKLFLPHQTLGELVRSSFWEDRVLAFAGDRNKGAAQDLFRRAALFVGAPGEALELLPFMPPRAVVILLEPHFDDPAAGKGKGKGKGKEESKPEEDPQLEQHKREAELLSATLHAFAEACQLQLLTVACSVATPSSDRPGVPKGLQCWQDRIVEALAAAEDALCQSGLLGPTPACGVPQGTIPGTKLAASGVEQLAKWAACVGEHGKWVYDPVPRRLPWGEVRVAHPGACDEGFMKASAADALAAQVLRAQEGEAVDGWTGDAAITALEKKWDVRLSLKYRWAVDGSTCPAPDTASAVGEGEVWEGGEGKYGRHWQPFTTRGLCSAMAGGGKKKHILFLGDSLSEQMATAMAFNMLLDEDKPVDGKAFQKERPQDCLEFLKARGAKDAISCFTFTARACPGGQVTFLRNNRLRIVTDSVPEDQVAYYLPFSTAFRYYADDADCIVINRGAHFTHTARYALELRSTCRLLRERYPDKLILFRNTPPGHANCTDHDRPLEQVQDPSSLPLKFNWKHFLEQNEVAKGIVAEFGILYLDVYSMTKLRADGHKGANKNFVDCLHYCNPGVLDYWIELLYNTLRLLRLHSS